MILTRDKKFYTSLVKLAIPMILQNLITFCVTLADNLMIGSLGDTVVSGVYMASQLQTVLQVLSMGIESTILLIASQYWGKNDTASVRKIISSAFPFALFLGLLFTVTSAITPTGVISIFTPEIAVREKGAEYLAIVCYSYFFFCITQMLISSMRSVQSAGIGMAVSLVSLVVNVGLNYVLIFGKFGFPELGIKGAAIATLTARIVEMIVTVIYVRFFDRKLKIRPKHLLHIDKTILKDLLRYGAPIMAGQIVWGTNLFANSIIMGQFEESVIAATSVANTIYNLMYVCLNGVSGAVGVIIGKTVGSGKLDKIREYAHTVEIIFVVIGLMTSAAFYLLCDPFISFYNISPDAVETSRQFIHLVCITCIGSCYQCGCLFGLVKSGGDVSFVFKNDAIHIFLIVLPSAILARYLGAAPWIVFVLLKSDQILKCFVAFFKIRKFNWMKSLTKKPDEKPA